MNETPCEITLQVLICTLGEAGIQRIARANHPRVAGVQYLVSWQLPDGDAPVPEELSGRADFIIIKTKSRGLSKNRNLALEAATAPLSLISDDDILYSESGLKTIIKSFNENPASDILTFRYESKSDKKSYPVQAFPLSSPPKGYFITSFEIAFRTEKIKGKIRFNENFGIGAKFIAGEEDIFIHDALKAGLKGSFVPATIASHEGPTTSTRLAADPALICTKGAVFTYVHPRTWPLRMLTHAWRNRRVANGISTFTYIKSWLDGAFSK